MTFTHVRNVFMLLCLRKHGLCALSPTVPDCGNRYQDPANTFMTCSPAKVKLVITLSVWSSHILALLITTNFFCEFHFQSRKTVEANKWLWYLMFMFMFMFICHIANREAPLHPRTAGGGGVNITPPPLLRNIRHSSKTVTDIDMKLSVPYGTTIWRTSIPRKLYGKLMLFRKWRFSDVMSRDFRSKMDENEIRRRLLNIEVNCKRKTSKSRKANSV